MCNTSYFTSSPTSSFLNSIPPPLLFILPSLYFTSDSEQCSRDTAAEPRSLLSFRGHLKQEEGLWPLTSALPPLQSHTYIKHDLSPKLSLFSSGHNHTVNTPTCSHTSTLIYTSETENELCLTPLAVNHQFDGMIQFHSSNSLQL